MSYQTQEGPTGNTYPAQLLKFSNGLDPIWNKSFDMDIPGALDSFAISALGADSDGGVFAWTGGKMDGFAEPASLTRFDANGSIVWSKPVTNPIEGSLLPAP